MTKTVKGIELEFASAPIGAVTGTRLTMLLLIAQLSCLF